MLLDDDGAARPHVITLRPMTPAEFEVWVTDLEAGYAESLTGRLPVEAARRKAATDVGERLADGPDTAGHLLLTAVDGDAAVGRVWLATHEPQTGTAEVAWLHHVWIEPDRRGQGLGGAVLAAVEEVAASLGAARLGLNVFAGNEAALALYRSRGYRTTSRQMARDLGA